MAIQAERARGTEGRRRQVWGAAAGLAVAALGGALGAIYLAPPLPAANFATALVIILVLGGIAVAAAVAARWVHAALAGRVDILSQALDASPDAQLVVAADGRMAYANTVFESLFPGDDDRPVERIARALVEEPQAGADFHRLLERAAAGARAIATVPLRGPRGGVAGWFNVSVNPIAGRPGYCFWHIQDVTARHEMEALIRDERNKLVDFLDNAPIGFYSVDGNGRFLFVNQTLARWLGDTPQQIVASGARLHDFLAAPPPEGTAPADPFGGEDDGAQRGEVVLRGRQGRIVHAWIGQSAVGSGEELRTRSVVRDLTPEREWEIALRRSRERFERFFTDAPVGIAMLDHSGRFAEANAAVGELFGALPQELIGQKLADFVQEESRRDLAARLAARAEADMPAGPIEVRLAGARERMMALFPRRLAEAADDEGGLIVHVIDITEQKNLEIQFAQSQKMQAVGQLAGGVAHDFNNLLTAMIGFCDLLLLRFHPGDPSFADIMQIKQNANRAANLVRQLLAFSRQQALQPRVLDITDVLVELSHLLRRLIGEKIELNVVHGRELGLAKVDQGQLEQVIINLAVNARDAMPNGGRLRIRTADLSQPQPLRRGPEVLPPGDYVLIEVADTGVGIAKENLARIFEPFFSTKEIGSGTGLGLSTVYGIVKQTGGFIFVDSAPGQGSTFQIYLPRHQEGEERPALRAEAAEPPAGRDLTGVGTVMLVEDDDPVRIFGARALRNKGYSVIEAKSGEAALELIRNAPQKIDLVITDVVMPQMDGPELIRAVREFDNVIKVIFISGYAEMSFRERLGSDSDIHFLPKPFNLKQLAAKVKEVMSGEAA